MKTKTKIKTNFNEKAAERAIFFIEQLKHSTGEYGGQNFKLMDWQRDRIIKPLFGTLNADGSRQYRTCFCEVPRKAQSSRNSSPQKSAPHAAHILMPSDWTRRHELFTVQPRVYSRTNWKRPACKTTFVAACLISFTKIPPSSLAASPRPPS